MLGRTPYRRLKRAAGGSGETLLHCAPMLQATAESAFAPAPPQVQTVRHLRQVLLWPLRLVPTADGDDSEQRRAPWRALRALGDASPWREQLDEYTGEAAGFHERHYN